MIINMLLWFTYGIWHPYEKTLHGSYTATIYPPYLNRPELPSVFHVRPIHVLYKIRPIMATFILNSTHTTCRGFLRYIWILLKDLWVLHDKSMPMCMVLGEIYKTLIKFIYKSFKVLILNHMLVKFKSYRIYTRFVSFVYVFHTDFMFWWPTSDSLVCSVLNCTVQKPPGSNITVRVSLTFMKTVYFTTGFERAVEKQWHCKTVYLH